MRRTAWWGLLPIALLLAGCGNPSTTAKELKSVSAVPPRPVDRADAIQLFASPPAAVNWDEAPGPDGVQARVLLFQMERPESVLVSGTLEFLLYEGKIPAPSVTSATPLRTWTFTGEDLRARQTRSMIGWGYAAQLGWGKDVPSASVISLVARYVAPTGLLAYSAPIAIAMPSPARSGPVKTTLGNPAAQAAVARLREELTMAARPLKFRRQIIDPDPPGAQHDITLLADLNGDGRRDIVIGCKRGQFNLFWYENPSWKRHDLASAPSLEAGGVVLDVNGDGRPDIVAGQQIGGKELYWFECPPDPAGPWPRHLIENRFEKYHDQAVGDVDGDGQPEIVVLSQRSGVLVYYDIPADPMTSPWPRECCHEVATDVKDVEGLVVVDIDGDKQTEIIAGMAIYRRQASGGWKGTPFAEGFKMARVAVADLDGDGVLDIVLCEGESHPGRLVWFKGPSWTPHPLRADLFHPHSLEIADFNGDGRPDIFVAEMGLGRNATPRMFIYAGRGKGEFEEVLIGQGVPTHEAKVADIDGDGKPDIVGKPYEPEKHVDVWFNET